MGVSTTPQAQTPESRPYWAETVEDELVRLGSTADGLSSAEAEQRLGRYGPNRLSPGRRGGVLRELRRQFAEPIIVILVGATVLSLVLGDTVDASIILGIIALSGLLGFWQEHGASVTVARLLARVQIHVEVRRDGTVVSVAPDQVVPGDVLVLNAGDLIPCDCRLLTAQTLQVDEAALTGETYPRHKHPEPAAGSAPLAERHSALFQGSHVVSGKGEALAVLTGEGTELGRMSHTLTAAAPRTSFETGMTRFGLLLARVTALLTTALLVVNVVLGRPFIDSVLFSLALAIGVTPQMLPAIVSVSLSAGARRMARAEVVVRRLAAIEDLGSMDVLCTDKTGTLTLGAITLESALDAAGATSDRVGRLAAANARFQTGFTNPLDDAVLATYAPDPAWSPVAELPFDFERKRLSVLMDTGEGRLLVTKGAFGPVLDVCSSVEVEGAERPVGELREQLDEQFRRLSGQGLRVVAVAVAERGGEALTVDDETGLRFVGLLTFADPPKPGVKATLRGLSDGGIRVCMLTGDNRLVARHVAEAVGMSRPAVLTGADVDALDHPALLHAVTATDVFAELSPMQKERIIEATRAGGAVVGYIGDGVNDAGPLHLADVGISVDTAVDVAKSAAAMVLLDKDLGVVLEGIRLGRQTFANTLKYVYTTISANFGNVASMACASAFLPFLPLLPRQILLLNFLSDLPSLTIAQDRVDAEELDRPRRWDVHQVAHFMVVFGLLSSFFDLLTFALLLQVFDTDVTSFRTAWFIGSTLTEIAVLFVLRTRRVAFRSAPGRGLVVTSVLVGALVVALPFVGPLASPLGLDALAPRILAALAAVTGAYIVSAELTKRWFFRNVRVPTRPATPTREERLALVQQRRIRRVAREHGRA